MKRALLFVLSLAITSLGFFGCGAKNENIQTNPYPQANPPSDFEYTVSEEENYSAITKYVGNAKSVVIPKKLGGAPVKLIYGVAFMGADITSVVMPESVMYIGDYAFSNCRYLETIKFSENIQVIGIEAFKDCTALGAAKLPSKLEKIGSYAFYRCTALRNVVIPENLEGFRSECAFAMCTGLKSIIFEDGIERIGGYGGFANAILLEELVFPASVKKVDGSTFAGSSMLKKVVFLGDAPEPDTSMGTPFGERDDLVIYYDANRKGWDTTYLREHYILKPLDETVSAFQKEAPPAKRCGNFEYEIVSGECEITKYVGISSDVVIPEKIDGTPVKRIGRGAFSYFPVKKVSMPSSVTTIKPFAFWGCAGLKEITLSRNVRVLEEGVFNGCAALENIDLTGITEIKSNALSDCSLRNVTIPKSLVKWTGERMFASNRVLTSLTFEEGVKSIGGDYCFVNCSSLTEIVFPSSVEYLASGSFLNCRSLTKITFEGNAPTIDSSAELPCDNDDLTIFYDPSTDGWDTTPLKNHYNLMPIE